MYQEGPACRGGGWHHERRAGNPNALSARRAAATGGRSSRTREQLPQGFICERVNLSDWESKRCIGGVFNGSTWAEVSNLLVQVECIDHPEVRSWLGC